MNKKKKKILPWSTIFSSFTHILGADAIPRLPNSLEEILVKGRRQADNIKLIPHQRWVTIVLVMVLWNSPLSSEWEQKQIFSALFIQHHRK
jgi:hypothetical protein